MKKNYDYDPRTGKLTKTGKKHGFPEHIEHSELNIYDVRTGELTEDAKQKLGILESPDYYDSNTGKLTEEGIRNGSPKLVDSKTGQLTKLGAIRVGRGFYINSKGKYVRLTRQELAKAEHIENQWPNKREYTPMEEILENAHNRCNLLRPVLNNPMCDEETKHFLSRGITDLIEQKADFYQIPAKDLHIMLDDVYSKNPDFFPNEAPLAKERIEIRSHLEERKAQARARLKATKPEDRISGTVAVDLMLEGIEKGLIDPPTSVESANMETGNIRKRLGIRADIIARKKRERLYE